VGQKNSGYFKEVALCEGSTVSVIFCFSFSLKVAESARRMNTIVVGFSRIILNRPYFVSTSSKLHPLPNPFGDLYYPMWLVFCPFRFSAPAMTWCESKEPPWVKSKKNGGHWPQNVPSSPRLTET